MGVLRYLVWIWASVASSAKDFYKILGVPKSATDQQIKKAFRKLSMKNHPDKFAKLPPRLRKMKEKKFMAMSEAYETLSDPSKRREYDAGGGRGGGGGGRAGGSGGAHTGGQGGSFNFNFGGGGPFEFGKGGGKRPDVKPFAGAERFVKPFESEQAVNDAASRLSVVIAYYQSAHEEVKNFKDGFRDFAKKFSELGIVHTGAVDCKKHKSLCEKRNVRKYPAVMYSAPRVKTVWQHTYSGSYSAASLENWVAKVMANECRELKSMFRLRRWLATNQSTPKVLVFSDKDKTPPIVKALSVDFSGLVALGVVLKGAEEEIAAAFGISKYPSMLSVLDKDSLEAEQFDQEFKKKSMESFLHRVWKRRKTSSKAAAAPDFVLTEQRFRNGECAHTDSKFCLLFISRGTATLPTGIAEACKKLTTKFKSDPIRILVVTDDRFASDFSAALDAQEAVVLYRPKRKRYKVFSGSPGDLLGIIDFVEGALQSGGQLPELLGAAPRMREEL